MNKVIFLASLFLKSLLFGAPSDYHRSIEPQPSLNTAYAWTILGTAVPIAAGMALGQSTNDGQIALASSLILAGGIIGPSLGQFYAESPSRGLLGIGIRTGGATLATVGLVRTFSKMFCGFDAPEGEEQSCYEDNDGPMLFLGGGLIWLGGTIFSFIDTGLAIKRLNDHPSESQFGWQPMIIPGENGNFQSGLAAWMHF